MNERTIVTGDVTLEAFLEIDLAVVEGATHLFEEAGKLEEVQALTRDWFIKYLQ